MATHVGQRHADVGPVTPRRDTRFLAPTAEGLTQLDGVRARPLATFVPVPEIDKRDDVDHAVARVDTVVVLQIDELPRRVCERACGKGELFAVVRSECEDRPVVVGIDVDVEQRVACRGGELLERGAPSTF